MLELNADNTAKYLAARGGPGPMGVTALTGGVSNAVLRVRTPERLLVLKQSRSQLRTRERWVSDLDRVFREVAVMRLLGGLLPQGTVPEVLFVDEENYVFAMSHAPVDAVVWKQSLLAGQTEVAVARHAGVLLGLMHERTAVGVIKETTGQGDPERTRRIEETDLADRRVFEQLRTEPFYERLLPRQPMVADAIQAQMQELRTRCEALCHGDFTPKNILVHPEAEGAFTLVDYETAHLGDPTMDLGLFLAHLVLKAIRGGDQAARYLMLTKAFWVAYGSVVRFRPMTELMARGIQHFGVCLLTRIDGTSPVDYLREPQREAARRIGHRILLEKPREWSAVLTLVTESLTG